MLRDGEPDSGAELGPDGDLHRQDALRDWLTSALAASSLLLLVRYRMNSAWLMAGGALIGLAGHVFGFAP